MKGSTNLTLVLLVQLEEKMTHYQIKQVQQSRTLAQISHSPLKGSGQPPHQNLNSEWSPGNQPLKSNKKATYNKQ